MPPRAYVLVLLPLLSAGAVVTLRRNSTPDTCDCVPWHDAYHKYGMVCGDGHELDLVKPMPGSVARMIPPIQFEFCQQFFGQLPGDAFCMKTKFDASLDAWCYVPNACPTSLSVMTSQTGKGLKRKLCDSGRDKILGDMPFEAFADYMFSSKLELGLAVQFTYPTLPDMVLPDVMQFWGLTAPAALTGNKPVSPLSETVRMLLQAHVDSGKPAFIRSVSGHPPFAVSEGKKLYWINFSEKNKERERTRQNVWAHREEMNAWKCVAGCWINSSPF